MDMNIIRDEVLDLQKLKKMVQGQLIFSFGRDYIAVKDISYKDGRVFINHKPVSSYTFLSKFHGAFFHLKDDVCVHSALEVLDRLCREHVDYTIFYFGDEEVPGRLLYDPQTDDVLSIYDDLTTDEIVEKYIDISAEEFAHKISGFCEGVER